MIELTLKHALADLEIDIRFSSSARCLALFGDSGAGKTTILNAIAGLLRPRHARIVLDNQILIDSAAGIDMPPAARGVGYVFQDGRLFPHLSVRGNLLFPLENTAMPRAQREARVAEIARRLGIDGLLDRFPRQLPGGDQQRVSLGRALVRQPRLWLMDEPLGTLDSDRRQELREVIRAQQLEHGVTTLYVTHDQEEAMTLADRIVVMEQGVIRQAGTPEEVYEQPADLFTAGFVGSPGMNRLEGVVRGGIFTAAGVPAALPDGPVVLGVRSEYVLPDDDGPLRGVVVMDEYLGAWRNLHLDCPCGRLVMRLPPGAAHRPGQAIGMRIDPAHALFFAPGDGRRLA